MTQRLNKIRRQLLITLGSIPLACWLKTGCSATDQDYAMASYLTNLFQDRSSAQMIGLLYLKITPDEADIKQLLSCILHEYPEFEILAANKDPALSTRIRILQQNDFEKEQVVNIDGWVLSHMEARLCALSTFL